MLFSRRTENKKTNQMTEDDELMYVYGDIPMEDRLLRGYDPKLLSSYDRSVIEYLKDQIEHGDLDTSLVPFKYFLEGAKERFGGYQNKLGCAKMHIQCQDKKHMRFSKVYPLTVDISKKDWYERACKTLNVDGIYTRDWKCIKGWSRKQLAAYNLRFMCRGHDHPMCKPNYKVAHCYRKRGPSKFKRLYYNIKGYLKNKLRGLFTCADASGMASLLTDGNVTNEANKIIYDALETPEVYKHIYDKEDVDQFNKNNESIFKHFCKDYCNIENPTQEHYDNVTDHFYNTTGVPLKHAILHTLDKYENYRNAIYSRNQYQGKSKKLSKEEIDHYWGSVINEIIDHQGEQHDLSNVRHMMKTKSTYNDKMVKSYATLLNHMSKYEHPEVTVIGKMLEDTNIRGIKTHKVSNHHKDNVFKHVIHPLDYHFIRPEIASPIHEDDLFDKLYYGSTMCNPNPHNMDIIGHFNKIKKKHQNIRTFSKKLSKAFKKNKNTNMKSFMIIPKNPKTFDDKLHHIQVKEDEMQEEFPSVHFNQDIHTNPIVSLQTKDKSTSYMINPLNNSWSIKTVDGVKPQNTKLSELKNSKYNIQYFIEC